MCVACACMCCMCVCVCVYCMCMHMCTCACVCVCMPICVCGVCVHACVLVCMCMCLCMLLSSMGNMQGPKMTTAHEQMPMSKCKRHELVPAVHSVAQNLFTSCIILFHCCIIVAASTAASILPWLHACAYILLNPQSGLLQSLAG